MEYKENFIKVEWKSLTRLEKSVILATAINSVLKCYLSLFSMTIYIAQFVAL